MPNCLKLAPIVFLLSASFLAVRPASAEKQWSSETLNNVRGAEVYWNAWGGDERINNYIDWVREQVKTLYGIQLEHVKITNTADAVVRVRTEVSSGRTEKNGSVDLIWINGENFATMKAEGLLYGPFASDLPYFNLIDTDAKPTTIQDFTIPTDGYESPWGMAQFNLMIDSSTVPMEFVSLADLASWTAENPGRFSYPRPPDFIGVTFLKQVMLETVESDFKKPFDGNSKTLAPVVSFLDSLHPNLWRKGKSFPASGPVLRDMLSNREVDIALSFNPSEAASLVLNEEVSATIKAIGLGNGTIANSHFVAIPINSSVKEAARVVANFLLSPEAQARKASLTYWGDPTVISLDRLNDSEQALFKAEPTGPTNIGPALPEPHPSWTEALEQLWETHYGR